MLREGGRVCELREPVIGREGDGRRNGWDVGGLGRGN